MLNYENLGKFASSLTFGAMALAGGPFGIAIFLFQEAPMWKIPGQPGGYNFLDMVYSGQYGWEHIPTEQAQEEAYYLWYPPQ